MEQIIRPGMVVECVDTDCYGSLTVGKTYKALATGEYETRINIVNDMGNEFSYPYECFKIFDDKTNQMKEMQPLQIVPPKGYEVDSFNKDTNILTFKKIKKLTIIERIKTIDDLLDYNSYTRSHFSGYAKDIRAYMLLKLLVETLNEGWKHDWGNNQYDKWYPWFYLAGGSSGFQFDGSGNQCSVSVVCSRLVYKDKKTSDYAGTQFIDLYRDFMLFD